MRSSDLAEIVDRVVDGHPAEVARYQAGEEQLLGSCMKESEGTADPAT
jgi:Asp-tRNA(Asn)/Glu-tRNA(Gln) amidotransferase B subunit